MSRLALPGLALALQLAGCDRVFGFDPPAIDAPVPGEWAAVSSGGLHSCAIQTDRSLWCWGENFIGQLGLGATAPPQVLMPTKVGAATWSTTAAGVAHTCGIQEDGTLWCWGYNLSGSVGDGTHANRSDPTAIGTDHWRSLAVGDYHSCAIRDDRSLWCWGLNTSAQLGDGTLGERASPVLVDSTHAWAAVTAGAIHTCALTMDEQLWCWGSDASGAIGAGVTISMVPRQIEPGFAWSAVAAGNGFTCGITEGSVRCWGANDVGQLGDGTTLAHASAAPISSPRTDWASVVTHSTTVCALANDGALACWGENRQGEIGSDTAAPIQSTPHPISVPSATWKAIAPGTFHACAIDGASHLWCSGDNGSGQVGNGEGGSQLVPLQVEGSWTAIVAGAVSTCGVRDGQLWCWGDNGAGELGDGTTVARQTPVQTSLPKAPSTTLTVGTAHACAIDVVGELYCWGDNRRSQAAGAGLFVLSPTRVSLVPVVGGVSAHEHTCALGYDHYAYCIGRNDEGQLGRGFATNPSQLLPVPNPTIAGNYYAWATVRTGMGHTCGLIQGSLLILCWGRNAEGQIGNGTTTLAPVPVSIAFAAQLDVGGYHTCAIASNGKLTCWGANSSGQLGDGTSSDRLSPTAIGTAIWKAISTGAVHTCGIQADDSLWCWGPNIRGELGTGSFGASSAPTRVGTASWRSVSAGTSFTCGIQMDGSAWCWGDRLNGQLGDGKSWLTRFTEIGRP